MFLFLTLRALAESGAPSVRVKVKDLPHEDRLEGPVRQASCEHPYVQRDRSYLCVCTFKRPQQQQGLLEGLRKQDTGGRFTYSAVIVDNDHLRPSEAAVLDFAPSSPFPVRYSVKLEQGIPKARNRAVANAEWIDGRPTQSVTCRWSA